MPQIKLKFHCWLSRGVVADSNTYEEDLIAVPEGETLGRMIYRLSADSKFFRNEIFDYRSQMVKENVTVLLNGRLVNPYESAAASLKEGDVVVFLPAMYGG